MPESNKPTISDVVKFNIPELSIDYGTFSAAANKAYAKMTPVALDSDGKYVATNPAATDSTKVTVGLLLRDVASESAAHTEKVSILCRAARVIYDAIDWSAATWTDAQKKSAKEELAALLIVNAKEI